MRSSTRPASAGRCGGWRSRSRSGCLRPIGPSTWSGSGPAARYLAQRLCGELVEAGEAPPVLGAVDITLYRDDVFRGLPKPEIGPTELPRADRRAAVVLVDDVLFTGRTIRAAIDALVDYGRPRAVELAVLVDRGRRELPIQPDFVGRGRCETTAGSRCGSMLAELGEPDRVVLRERRA